MLAPASSGRQWFYTIVLVCPDDDVHLLFTVFLGVDGSTVTL